MVLQIFWLFFYEHLSPKLLKNSPDCRLRSLPFIPFSLAKRMTTEGRHSSQFLPSKRFRSKNVKFLLRELNAAPCRAGPLLRILSLTALVRSCLGCRHSSVDSSAPSILPPGVRVPRTTTFSFNT